MATSREDVGVGDPAAGTETSVLTNRAHSSWHREHLVVRTALPKWEPGRGPGTDLAAVGRRGPRWMAVTPSDGPAVAPAAVAWG
jgi:hypothetical protein